MALIHHKGNSHTAQLLGGRGILLFIVIVPLHNNLHFLNGGNNNNSVLIFQLLQQFMDIICIIHINNVIFRISLEG